MTNGEDRAVVSSEAVDRSQQRARGRVLLAKLGLDGHDVGAKAIVYFLRDAGYEVIYLGIRQRPDQVARVAIDEDVDVVGISMLSGAHMELVPRITQRLREAGVDIPVLLGGTIPEQDFEPLRELGVRGVFTPGSPLRAIGDRIAELIQERGTAVTRSDA